MNQYKLEMGDMVGLTAPASPVTKEHLQQAIAILTDMGFKVFVGETCHENVGGYLAGTREQRAHELQEMFINPDIKAIFCVRGGYGTPQILDLLDYEQIAMNAKPLIGYSDITALHIALQQKSNMSTFHGPMPASDLRTADSFTVDSMLSVLLNRDHSIVVQNPLDEDIKCLVPGESKGILTGGNLSLITSLLGTPYEIDTKGKILFLEEIGEQPYKIDRMLTQLQLAGKLKDAAGFVLGTWTNCIDKDRENGYQVEDLFQQVFLPLGKPTIYNLRAGHCMPAVTLPLGELAILHAEKRKLVIDVV